MYIPFVKRKIFTLKLCSCRMDQTFTYTVYGFDGFNNGLNHYFKQLTS